MDEGTFLCQIDRIASFERAQAADGSLILKFWMHLSHDAQEARFKSFESDPLTAARCLTRTGTTGGCYDNFVVTAEQIIARTNAGDAPWIIAEGADPNSRGVTVATRLRSDCL